MATATMQPAPTGQPSLPNLTVLEAPDGQVLLFKAQGRGVQIYPWDPATQTFGTAHPEAILLTHRGHIIHHSTGPTWTAADGSSVVGAVLQKVNAPAEDAIPWLLLKTTPGDTAGVLSKVSFIQRVYTEKGVAPSHPRGDDDVATETPVFYEAEYYFYVPKDGL